jgi:sulfur-oxidizing protein SoxY
MSTIDRRRLLKSGAAGLLLAAAPTGVVPALAANDTAEAIAAFTGGKTPTAGKIALDLPEIAENGNTVPLTLAVDSPMTAESHVTEVLVLAEANPNAGVAKFTFTPLAGKAEAAIRIRLAATQNVIVLAKTSDGGVLMDKKLVKVTIGGCGG